MKERLARAIGLVRAAVAIPVCGGYSHRGFINTKRMVIISCSVAALSHAIAPAFPGYISIFGLSLHFYLNWQILLPVIIGAILRKEFARLGSEDLRFLPLDCRYWTVRIIRSFGCASIAAICTSFAISLIVYPVVGRDEWWEAFASSGLFLRVVDRSDAPVVLWAAAVASLVYYQVILFVGILSLLFVSFATALCTRTFIVAIAAATATSCVLWQLWIRLPPELIFHICTVAQGSARPVGSILIFSISEFTVVTSLSMVVILVALLAIDRLAGAVESALNGL